MYDISKIISKPYTFDKIESDKLAELSVRYPFFQTANILLCKALYDSKSIKFKSQLKKAAAQSANRSTLFKILNEQTKIEKINNNLNKNDNTFSFSEWISIIQTKKTLGCKRSSEKLWAANTPNQYSLDKRLRGVTLSQV